MHGFGIGTHSADAEIINLSQGWKILNNIPSDELPLPVTEDLIALSYNKLNKHLIVVYDVRYHKDVFGDKQPFLENKVMFAIRLQGHVTETFIKYTSKNIIIYEIKEN